MSLARNLLNDNDAILILQALKRNTNLEEIRLHTNNFTSIDVNALLTCVFDSSSLNAISESNHMLIEMKIYTYPRDDSWLQDCIKRLLELTGRRNIACLARQRFSTPISCKYTIKTHARGSGIPSLMGLRSTSTQMCEYSVLNNAVVDYALALS